MEKFKTEWNLGLLYKSDKDPQIEKDMQAIEKACTDFEKKYRNKNFTATPQTLLQALKAHDELEKIIINKPLWYFSLKKDINTSNTSVTAQITKLEQRVSLAANKITFFSLQIGKIPKKDQKKFLEYKPLASYKYMLERVFAAAVYMLSEQEEQLENLLSQTSVAMWIENQEKLLNEQTVLFKKEQIPISKAQNLIKTLPKKERRELASQVNEKLKSVSFFAEAELNAIFNYKKIMDERRGYQRPYSATVLGYQNEEKTVLNLVAIIEKHFSISKRFYKLHAQLLGEKKITYADKDVSIGAIKKKFTLDHAVDLVTRSFNKIDPKYSKYLSTFLKHGQIDVYPKMGKQGGGYCAGYGDLPQFILLNHVDDLYSVETLAHEMGHAIHTELTRKQPLYYRDYSYATAEVASIFFEQLVTDELTLELSEKEHLVLLHSRLCRDIAVIFRQIAFFNFELELHEAVRKEGHISKEVIASLLVKHFRSYLGDTVSVADEDGYLFVAWPHLRYFFYVYTYAFGLLVSRSLYENWKKDPTFSAKIEEFLEAGGSASPEDIFKKIGIDVTNPAFFESGLKAIEADIKKLESLAKKQKLI